MFILTIVDDSDFYINETDITVSSNKEALEAFIAKYKNIREEYYSLMDCLYTMQIAQNKNQSKLKPFVLDYKREFYPTLPEYIDDHRLFRATRAQAMTFDTILSDFRNQFDFPIDTKTSQEKFVISKISCID